MRRDERTTVKLRATVSCMKKESRGVVLDVSENGMALYLSTDIGASVGKQVTVLTEEFGLLSGFVRWSRFPRLGVELTMSSNTAAKITSFFRNYA